VLGNFRKHDRRSRAAIDPFSSAPFFPGFREYRGVMPIDAHPERASRKVHPPWVDRVRREGLTVVFPPSTWLLRAGWRKLGELSVYDGPSAGRGKTASPV
jgi:hypothetical protein